MFFYAAFPRVPRPFMPPCGNSCDQGAQFTQTQFAIHDGAAVNSCDRRSPLVPHFFIPPCGISYCERGEQYIIIPGRARELYHTERRGVPYIIARSAKRRRQFMRSKIATRYVAIATRKTQLALRSLAKRCIIYPIIRHSIHFLQFSK